MQERWKIIDEFPAYLVSNYGRIKRAIAGRSTPVGHFLRPSLTRRKNPYLKVKLWLLGIDHGYSRRVHQLVANAFIGPQPHGHEIDHLNRNHFDNRVYNLQYIPSRENKLRGQNNPRSKLTDRQVQTIRSLSKSYVPGQRPRIFKTLAKKYHVGSGAISNIYYRRSWTHLQPTSIHYPRKP